MAQSVALNNVFKLRPKVSVKEPRFGAKGDGVTDDTAAIQAAIDFIIDAGGGEVYFPRGIYQVGTPLKITSDFVTLRGEICGQPFAFGGSAQSGTIIRAKVGFVGSHIIQVAQDAPTRSLVNCFIRDIAVGGFNATSSNGIYWMCVNGQIDNVFLAGMDCGVYSEGAGFGGILAPYDFFITNTRIQNVAGNGISFYNNASDARLVNVVINSCGGHGVYYDGLVTATAGSGNIMLGCYIYSCTGRAVYAQNMWQTEFVGCRFQDCNGGIYMDTVGSSFNGAGFKIVGNQFRNLSIAADNTTDGINITMDNVARGGVISGNSFYNDAGLDNPSYNKMRYGIYVGNANMQGLVIGPNSLGYAQSATGTFGTAFSNYGGTGTEVVREAAAEIAMRGQGLLAQNYDRQVASNQSLMIGGTAYAMLIGLKQGDRIGNVYCQVNAAGTDVTLFKAAIFSKDGATRYAVTADQDALFASTGVKTLPLTASWEVPFTGAYLIVFVATASTTLPALLRGFSTGGVQAIGSNAPAYATAGTGLSDLPSAGATITNSGTPISFWAGVGA